MKTLVAAVLLGAIAGQADARPSAAVIDACLRTESMAPQVRYKPLSSDAFQVIEDEEAGKTEIIFKHGTDTVGIWKVKKPQASGLLFNGKETPLARVKRIEKRDLPTEFNPYEAIWGEAREGKKTYICATFNFDRLGRSGSFQNVRGCT